MRDEFASAFQADRVGVSSVAGGAAVRFLESGAGGDGSGGSAGADQGGGGEGDGEGGPAGDGVCASARYRRGGSG